MIKLILMCVWERERESEWLIVCIYINIQREWEYGKIKFVTSSLFLSRTHTHILSLSLSLSLWWVCVCVWGREGEKEGGRRQETHQFLFFAVRSPIYRGHVSQNHFYFCKKQKNTDRKATSTKKKTQTNAQKKQHKKIDRLVGVHATGALSQGGRDWGGGSHALGGRLRSWFKCTRQRHSRDRDRHSNSVCVCECVCVCV